MLITVTFAFVFNTVQSNTIAESLRTQYHISPVITGIILAVITAIIIFGGVRSIATLSSLIVPIMAIVYVGIVLFILLMNFDQIIPMIGTIIKSAFGMEQVAGGAVGTAILQGIKRGLFSNEAGMGSAPNAAATTAATTSSKTRITSIFRCLLRYNACLYSNSYYDFTLLRLKIW